MSGPRGMRVATVAVLAVYAAVVLLDPAGVPAWTRDVVLGNLPLLAATCLLVRRAAARPEDRVWSLPLAVGTTCYLLGNGYYMAVETWAPSRCPRSPTSATWSPTRAWWQACSSCCGRTCTAYA